MSFFRFLVLVAVVGGGIYAYRSYDKQSQSQFVEFSQTFDRARTAALVQERMRASGGIPAEARDVTADSEVTSVAGVSALRFSVRFKSAGGEVALNPSAEFINETLMSEARRAAGASRIEGAVAPQITQGQPTGFLVSGKAWFSEWQRSGMPSLSGMSVPSLPANIRIPGLGTIDTTTTTPARRTDDATPETGTPIRPR